MISLLDPRHVLILPPTYDDMILAQSHVKHIIETSHVRVFRWTKDFKLGKDSTIVRIWSRLPYLLFPLHNPSYLQRIGNTIGKFLRIDGPTQAMQNLMHARICVKIDVSKPFLQSIWIGETKEDGFMQRIDYEGNNAFYTKCGLLGHVAGVCRKGQHKPTIKVVDSTKPQKAKDDKGKGQEHPSKPLTNPSQSLCSHQKQRKRNNHLLQRQLSLPVSWILTVGMRYNNINTIRKKARLPFEIN